MIKKVLIANRGEIACRIIRACRELGIKTVAIYSKADHDSLHVQIADEAVCIGEATNTDSYLNMSNVLMAAEISGADAVHPGYGYFSERAHFVEALEALHIKFIGPSAKSIQAMGDKATAKQTAIEVGCPVIPGSEGIVYTEAEAIEVAEKIGYPVLLKAVAGGGGRGIRRVNNIEDLTKLWKTTQSEAQASFGNGDLLVEKCVEEPRHVEIQLFGDEHGNMVYFGERECSVQNLRHQKLVEEAPCAYLSEKTRQEMGEAAMRVAKAVGYYNAGTTEFLLDKYNNFYFLEMNTRLQVEHPVTEEVTGVDLAKLQLLVAQGEKLPFTQSDVQLKGHAIEARITAQNPDKDFAPSTGKITKWCPPGGYGVRVDTYIQTGVNIGPFYDPMIAKLIVRANSRAEAIDKLLSSLKEFQVEGITTNISFLMRLIDHPDYRSGNITTSFVSYFLQEGLVGV
jgi:acetyl-CoA carboxylase biotin carboxylase subunit